MMSRGDQAKCRAVLERLRQADTSIGLCREYVAAGFMAMAMTEMLTAGRRLADALAIMSEMGVRADG